MCDYELMQIKSGCRQRAVGCRMRKEVKEVGREDERRAATSLQDARRMFAPKQSDGFASSHV